MVLYWRRSSSRMKKLSLLSHRFELVNIVQKLATELTMWRKFEMIYGKTIYFTSSGSSGNLSPRKLYPVVLLTSGSCRMVCRLLRESKRLNRIYVSYSWLDVHDIREIPNPHSKHTVTLHIFLKMCFIHNSIIWDLWRNQVRNFPCFRPVNH